MMDTLQKRVESHPEEKVSDNRMQCVCSPKEPSL